MKTTILAFVLCAFAATTASAQQKHTVTVYCFEQASKAQLDSVKVELYKGDSLMGTATTDSYGGHDFKNMNPGDYTIRFSRQGYGSGTTAVHLPQSDDVTANIGMSKRKAVAPTHKKK